MNVRPGEPIGVLGGTFDPVHLGHLRVADRVRRVLALGRLLLLPAAVPPHKRRHEPAPAHHREAMLRLAVADRPGLEVCTLELSRNRVCYTIDSLRELREGPPPNQPIFVLGTDALLAIHTWHCWRELLLEFDLVAVDRAGRTMDQVRRQLEPSVGSAVISIPDEDGAGREPLRRPRGRDGRILHIGTPPISISSSQIRATIAAGGSAIGLVPAPVAEYIQRTGIYRQEETR